LSRPAAHISTPLGMGFGHSRFSGPNRIFRLLYVAYDLATAIAETIVRDRFKGIQDRVLDYSEIGDWAVTEVTAAACRPSRPQDLGPVGWFQGVLDQTSPSTTIEVGKPPCGFAMNARRALRSGHVLSRHQ
jgi:hypothetical protein